MSKLFNRAKMTTTTTGTGNLTLGSAEEGFVTFATAGVVNGDVVRYCIEAENGTDFELGEGVYTASGTVLSRLDADVQLSSNSNNRITLAAGTHNVFITAVDSDFTQEMTVTVAGGKFVIDGTSQQIITLVPSITYRLDQSDSSNNGHPLLLASGGADGSTYPTGVRTVGTAGTAGSYVQIKLEQDVPAIWYKCSNHSGMGQSINIAAPASGAASAVGTLTKTFSNNEEATITLTGSISPVPNVSVFKEIAQVGLSSKGNWDVNSTASNYTRLNEATAVTLTPSAVGSGTFSLGSGSFAAADIGKTITGNGGVAVLTSAAGAYTTSTNFTNTNAIASGSWDMYGSVPKSDGSGLTISSFDQSGTQMNAGTVASPSNNISQPTYFASYNNSGYQWEVTHFIDDGLTAYQLSGTTIKKWTLSSAWDISTLSVAANYTGFQAVRGNTAIAFSATGDKVFYRANDKNTLLAYPLSTNYDLSTAGTVVTKTLSYQGSNSTDSIGQYIDNPTISSTGLDNNWFQFSPDGLYFVMHCWTSSGGLIRGSLSTAWDITTLTLNQSLASGASSSPAQPRVNRSGGGVSNNNAAGVWFSNDGKLVVWSDGSGVLSGYQYKFSTGWDFSTASVTTNGGWALPVPSGNSGRDKGYQSLYIGKKANNDIVMVGSVFLNTAAASGIATGGEQEVVRSHVIGNDPRSTSGFPNGQYFPSVTAPSGQIDSSAWTDINSMVADEAAGSGTLNYALSTDNHVTWKVLHNTSGTRSIVKNNSGTWQINTNATYGSETWANATTNTELAALQQALATANNRMDKTQLDAVADANQIALGDTLDLMIAPYITSGTPPLSDGVTINYDGSALNRQAINGTDYQAEFPSATSVKIKSLAAQNLKVRVL